MWKKAGLTDVQMKVTDYLHKEGKAKKLDPSIIIESWLEGKC